MSLRVAVIGAGWYGCHIGLSLAALGFEVNVFEQHRRPLHEASGNNQFRLHLGFHYPRHYTTRLQSRDGFMRFMERYPSLSEAIPENIYTVPREDSLIDFLTYRLIMTSSGIHFTETSTPSIRLTNVDGVLLTGERVLLLERAREYFKRRLGSSLVLGHRVSSVLDTPNGVLIDGQRYDLLIDATWGHNVRPPGKLFYEPTLLLYYETASRFPAVTMVDGPLCSIYPTEDPNIYTLSSVPHTPLGRFETAQEAVAFRNAVDGELVAAKAKLMEEQVMRYVPDFHDHFRFIGPQLAIKTKLVGSHDDRSCYVFRNGNIFSVMSGKIDTIFHAVERILSMIEASYGSEFGDLQSSLKKDIALIPA